MGVDALRELHKQHAVAVRAYALRRSDSHTADDVCAEVWAIAWRRIDEMPQDALPWLFGVARRVLANERRRQRRLVALRERLAGERRSYVFEPQLLPDDPVLGRALRRLKPADAEVLLLVAWEDLSPARAGAVLGVRPGTFTVRLHRARARLAAALKEEEAEMHAHDSAHRPVPPPTAVTSPRQEIT